MLSTLNRPSPQLKTDEPPAYDLDQQDGYESRASGFDRQDAFDRRDENYNGYPVRNKAYDEESLVSEIIMLSSFIVLIIFFALILLGMGRISFKKPTIS